MCGICGFISKKDISIEQLRAMNDTMYHRGPDDAGVEIYVGKQLYTIGMAQRRLSILDLSALGHQPMHSQNGRISVVYNGEIYNFLEIKEELSDYPFQSTCDTEVILAAYQKWGIDCIRKFNGMFAIALYDREIDTLYLVRDRIGKKPLYYASLDGQVLFASELKPIMAAPGFRTAIRQDILPRYLAQQYINAPDTIYENVYKLEPGMILEIPIRAAGNMAEWNKIPYWDLAKVYHENQKTPVKDYRQAKSELKELLKKATASRMIADVPLGAFLSGGYDSTLITALAQEISDTPLKTYCIGFEEKEYDEAQYAREVAAHLGTKHTEVYISEQEMFELVESIPQYYDEPFADSSQIPSMLVAKAAKQDVTVALSGDGGDEFYCGYNVYDRIGQAQKLDSIGNLTYQIAQLPGFKQTNMLSKLPFKARVIAMNRNADTKTQLGDSYTAVAEQMVGMDALSCKYEIEQKYDEKNWQMRRMLLDMDTYLPGDILCKVDRASMKYSLETRCPILDRDVMEYSFRLPHHFKYANGVKKRILKDIVYDYVPKEMLERPKTGFSVPLDKWMRGGLKEQLLAYSDVTYLRNQNLFDAEYVNAFVSHYLQTGDKGHGTGENYSRMMWAFFVFQQWYAHYRK